MKQRGLAARVRSEKRHPLAARDSQVHVDQHPMLVVAGVEVLDAQGDWLGASCERIPTDLIATQRATRLTAHVKNSKQQRRAATPTAAHPESRGS